MFFLLISTTQSFSRCLCLSVTPVPCRSTGVNGRCSSVVLEGCWTRLESHCCLHQHRNHQCLQPFKAGHVAPTAGGLPSVGGDHTFSAFVAVCLCTSEAATWSRPSRSTDVEVMLPAAAETHCRGSREHPSSPASPGLLLTVIHLAQSSSWHSEHIQLPQIPAGIHSLPWSPPPSEGRFPLPPPFMSYTSHTASI